MEQSKQEVQKYQEDEINLIALAYSLIERKFLILGLTAFITALAALYTTTFTPTYQAKVSILSAPSSSLLKINNLIYTSETKKSIFTSFLTNLISEDLKKNVFVENDFLTQFNKDNTPIDNVDAFIMSITSSVKVIPPELDTKLTEDPHSIIINGTNPKAISKYLDALVKRANSKSIEGIIQLTQQKISNRLDQIAIDSEMLFKKYHQNRLNLINRIKEEDGEKIRNIKDQTYRAKYQAKQSRLIQIALLTESVMVAKSLGIIENNFKNSNSANSDLTIAIGDNLDLPEWYSYGEKALTQTINLLKSRVSDDPFTPELVSLVNQLNEVQNNNLLKTLVSRQDDSPFIPELVALNLEKDRLESTNLNLLGAKSINIVHSARVTTNSRNKNIIVLLAFIGSFIFSIVLALIMNALKPDENNPT